MNFALLQKADISRSNGPQLRISNRKYFPLSLKLEKVDAQGHPVGHTLSKIQAHRYSLDFCRDLLHNKSRST